MTYRFFIIFILLTACDNKEILTTPEPKVQTQSLSKLEISPEPTNNNLEPKPETHPEEIQQKLSLTELNEKINEEWNRREYKYSIKGDNVKEKGNDGRTMLHFALRDTYIKLLKLLLQHPDTDLWAVDNFFGGTPLHLGAFFCKNEQAIKLLIEEMRRREGNDAVK